MTAATSVHTGMAEGRVRPAHESTPPQARSAASSARPVGYPTSPVLAAAAYAWPWHGSSPHPPGKLRRPGPHFRRSPALGQSGMSDCISAIMSSVDRAQLAPGSVIAVRGATEPSLPQKSQNCVLLCSRAPGRRKRLCIQHCKLGRPRLGRRERRRGWSLKAPLIFKPHRTSH